MASSKLEQVKTGTRIFVDAPIFIYHFTAVSADCRSFLERCERGDIQGVTSVVVLAEVSHRLMMIEAVASRKVSPGNVVKKLRKKPDVVQELHLYQEQVGRIPLMGIEIESLDLDLLLRSAELRKQHGFLTNDSLIAASVGELGIKALASGDQDFSRLTGIELFYPADVGSADSRASRS
ncbi:MAG: type II toxin-antitoxin system VapC family toxin [bacterium]|nr:type II toxin-antitoxin system VapC family toxin [bacterium]